MISVHFKNSHRRVTKSQKKRQSNIIKGQIYQFQKSKHKINFTSGLLGVGRHRSRKPVPEQYPSHPHAQHMNVLADLLRRHVSSTRMVAGNELCRDICQRLALLIRPAVSLHSLSKWVFQKQPSPLLQCTPQTVREKKILQFFLNPSPRL